jgi:class 3 adenylate cyclase
MSRIKQEAVRIVERHGGIVNQFVGDEVLAARTQYYRADMLARKREIEPGRSLLGEIQQQFRGWGIPAWQLKCKQALQTISGD